jgi:putative heme-binding domain-containing protein
MYRFVIEHPRWITAERLRTLDTRAGHDKGRIYRILAKDAPPRPIEDLSKLPPEELARRMDHPNGVVRDLIHRELVHRQDKSAVAALQAVASHSAAPAARAQALCALAGIGSLKPEHLHAAMSDTDGRVRREALRLAEPMLGGAAQLADAVAKLTQDVDASVRYQAALTLGEAEGAGVPVALAEIVRRSPLDVWTRAAVLSSAGPRAGELLELVGNHANVTGAFRTQLVVAMAATAPPEQVGRMVRLLFPDTAVADFELAGALLDALGRRSLDLAALPPEAAAKLVEIMNRARVAARPGKGPDDTRLAAFAMLGREPRNKIDLAIADEHLTAQAAPRMQAAALAVLRRSPDPEATQLMIAALPRVSPPLREQMLAALTGRPASAQALLSAIDTKHVAVSDLPASVRDKLLRHPDASLRDHAAKSLSASRPPARAAAMESFQPAMKLTGDPAKGRPLFEKSCAACHALAGVGHPVGPDLAALTDKSAGYLLTAIVDPNAAVEGRFVAYQLDTADGDTHVGLLADESAAAVTLVQPNGLRQSIPRGEIKSLSVTKLSLMPEGLEQGLTPQDLADLIAFVQRPGGK